MSAKTAEAEASPVLRASWKGQCIRRDLKAMEELSQKKKMSGKTKYCVLAEKYENQS